MLRRLNLKKLRSKKPRIIRHLEQWKLLYEAIGALSLILSLFALVIGTWISYISLETYQKEFFVRNRPYVIATEPRFAGKTADRKGKEYPYSVKVYIKNKSDIPATDVNGICSVLLNKKVVGITMATGTAVFTKEESWNLNVPLNEEIYKAAMDSKNRFELTVTIKYAGMLGGKVDAHQTDMILYYVPLTNTFRVSDMHMR